MIKSRIQYSKLNYPPLWQRGAKGDFYKNISEQLWPY
jgi:hypothetical protein